MCLCVWRAVEGGAGYHIWRKLRLADWLAGWLADWLADWLDLSHSLRLFWRLVGQQSFPPSSQGSLLDKRACIHSSIIIIMINTHPTQPNGTCHQIPRRASAVV